MVNLLKRTNMHILLKKLYVYYAIFRFQKSDFSPLKHKETIFS